MFTSIADSGAGRSAMVLRRDRVRTGRQVLTFVVNRKPGYAVIDPYNLYIDRDIGNNGAEVDVN